MKRNWRSFEEARNFIHSLSLKYDMQIILKQKRSLKELCKLGFLRCSDDIAIHSLYFLTTEGCEIANKLKASN